MGRVTKSPFFFAVSMFVAAFLANFLKPTHKIADQKEKVNLEVMIPTKFADWELDKTLIPLQLNPEAQATLKKIYAQTLSRTYINASGQRIMLSIAYGSDQSDSMQVHRPEVCYQAQGFQILKQKPGKLDLGSSVLPVKYVLAVQGSRIEPITYWVTIDDKITEPGFQQKLKQLQYGITGKIPDGMLVRVSSITSDEVGAYKLQAQFAKQMMAAMQPKFRARVSGQPVL